MDEDEIDTKIGHMEENIAALSKYLQSLKDKKKGKQKHEIEEIKTTAGIKLNLSDDANDKYEKY